jgi:plasmid stabilization system protein ParE
MPTIADGDWKTLLDQVVRFPRRGRGWMGANRGMRKVEAWFHRVASRLRLRGATHRQCVRKFAGRKAHSGPNR